MVSILKIHKNTDRHTNCYHVTNNKGTNECSSLNHFK